MKVIQFAGKRLRPVPILLNKDMLRGMKILHDNRTKCGVSSKFFFAIPGIEGSRLHFYPVLQAVARAANMKHPELLTMTRMRKHHATMAQVIAVRLCEYESNK
jgi:hypothetical protein